jgi:HEAT repeat protein
MIAWCKSLFGRLFGRKAASPAVNCLSVQELIRELGASSVPRRRWAATELGRVGSAAVPALVKQLQYKPVEVRQAAAWALGLIGPAAEPAVPALIRAYAQALLDDNRSVRDATAEALEQTRSAWQTSEELRRFITECEWQLSGAAGNARHAAAWSLGTIGPLAREALPALARAHVWAVLEGDMPMRLATADALQKIDGSGQDVSCLNVVVSAVLTTLTGFLEDPSRVVVFLSRIGFSRSLEVPPQWRAAVVIARAGAVALPALLQGLGHPVEELRETVKLTLAMIGPSAEPLLRQALTHPDGEIRW